MVERSNIFYCINLQPAIGFSKLQYNAYQPSSFFWVFSQQIFRSVLVYCHGAINRHVATLLYSPVDLNFLFLFLFYRKVAAFDEDGFTCHHCHGRMRNSTILSWASRNWVNWASLYIWIVMEQCMLWEMKCQLSTVNWSIAVNVFLCALKQTDNRHLLCFYSWHMLYGCWECLMIYVVRALCLWHRRGLLSFRLWIL